MGSDKYSVILMRDDSNVRRFRLSSFWIKFFIYFCLLLMAAAGGGGYFGYTFLQENMALEKELRKQNTLLAETQYSLERLQNVEKILQSNDPEELQSLFGSISIESSNPEPQAATPVNLDKLFHRVDLNLVRVENLSFKRSGDRSLRVSFDLTNADNKNTLSGRVELNVVTRDGQSLPVSRKDPELAFLIQRYKKITSTFAVPEGINSNDIYGIRIVIQNTGKKPIFTKTYSLSELKAAS